MDVDEDGGAAFGTRFRRRYRGILDDFRVGIVDEGCGYVGDFHGLRRRGRFGCCWILYGLVRWVPLSAMRFCIPRSLCSRPFPLTLFHRERGDVSQVSRERFNDTLTRERQVLISLARKHVMATFDQRMLNVESEVNQLKGAYDHLATKADLEKAKWQLGGLMITMISVATAILVVAIRFWS